MPTTTKVQREERRGLIGFLHALGFGAYVIVDLMSTSGRPIAVRTVYNDLKILEEREGTSLNGPAATAQGRAVFNQLWSPIQGILADRTRAPALLWPERLTLTQALWGAYLSRVHLEQAFGAMPKEPERIEVGVEVGEGLKALFKALASRMSEDAAAAMTQAMRSVNAEDRELLERMGLHS